MAEALDAGAEPVFYGIAPDDEQAIAELVQSPPRESAILSLRAVAPRRATTTM